MTNTEYQTQRIADAPESLIAKIHQVLTQYCEAEGVEMESALRDLLVDARHLCDVADVSYFEAEADAYVGYLEERTYARDHARLMAANAEVA